jgi:hypothetical protein
MVGSGADGLSRTEAIENLVLVSLRSLLLAVRGCVKWRL